MTPRPMTRAGSPISSRDLRTPCSAIAQRLKKTACSDGSAGSGILTTLAAGTTQWLACGASDATLSPALNPAASAPASMTLPTLL